MTTLRRPCITCGESCEGARCAAHRRPDRRPSPRDRGYDAAWVRLSKRARELQPWCSHCGTDQDLTLDHLRSLARGGQRRNLRLSDVQVLCRSCNSRAASTAASQRSFDPVM